MNNNCTKLRCVYKYLQYVECQAGVAEVGYLYKEELKLIDYIQIDIKQALLIVNCSRHHHNYIISSKVEVEGSGQIKPYKGWAI